MVFPILTQFFNIYHEAVVSNCYSQLSEMLSNKKPPQ